jgi:hypothetical protein
MNYRTAKITAADEDRILRKAEPVDAGLVRVECLRMTLPVLWKAGYSNPKPFYRYLVPVRLRENMPLMEVKTRSLKG